VHSLLSKPETVRGKGNAEIPIVPTELTFSSAFNTASNPVERRWPDSLNPIWLKESTPTGGWLGPDLLQSYERKPAHQGCPGKCCGLNMYSAASPKVDDSFRHDLRM